MGTKSNSYTENTSTGGGPIKQSCCLIHPTKDTNNTNNSSVSAHLTEPSSSQVVPYVPVFIEDNDVIKGAKEILTVIRPAWNLNFVEFKKFTDGITNKLVGCFYNNPHLIENNANNTETDVNDGGDVTGTGSGTGSGTGDGNLNVNEGVSVRDVVSGSGSGVLQSKTTNQSANDCYLHDEGEGEEEEDSNFAANNAHGIKVTNTRSNNSFEQNRDNVVLVRVYGNNTDLLIDRKAETQNFLLLHSYELAPSLYATFKNGLAYEYVPGDTLNTDSVLSPEVWPLVARKMAEMHRVVSQRQIAKQRKPMLWTKTQRFFDLVPETYSDPAKHKKAEKSFLPISRLRNEFEYLYKHLESLDSPLVFSHNDLLLGNVIYTKSTKTVSFIDYEYADYNFQGFDIGNHFAEMCGVDTVDYTLYPSREFQLEWLRVYLQSYYERNDITDDELNRLFVQVNQFALAAHIFWTVWSLIQAEHSNIEFDFIDYANIRYNEYLARKEEFLALALTDDKAID